MLYRKFLAQVFISFSFNIDHCLSRFQGKVAMPFISVLLGGMPDAVPYGYKNIHLMVILAVKLF